MLNEKAMRLILLTAVTVIHLLLIFFLTFKIRTASQPPAENTRVMRLTDITEYIPEPPPPAPPPPMQEIIPQVESIAETMIEADIIPEQIIVEPGSLITVPEITHSDDPWVGYISQSQISVLPQFNINEITADLIYPQIALRSGIEGRVILELFVDRTGVIQRIDILREEPAGRGFGDAAISAFTGRKGEPAYSNGLAVSCRYRYPVTFRIR